MPTYEFVKKRCSRCGKEFFGQQVFPTEYCEECFSATRQIHAKVRELLKVELMLDQINEDLARRIDALISRESPGTAVHDSYTLLAAINKVLGEEAKRRKLLKELGKLRRRV